MPANVEWPAGLVSGVADIPDGGYVVPLVFSGRVQVYDSHWKFLRGWNVEAHGGTFDVQAARGGTIDVYTARGRHHHVYSRAGDLLSSGSYKDPFPARDGRFVYVPTHPLLWIFSGAFASGIAAIAGMMGLVLIGKSRQRRAAR